MESRAETILGIVDDMIADFLYYDRKEDQGLPGVSCGACCNSHLITCRRGPLEALLKAVCLFGLAITAVGFGLLREGSRWPDGLVTAAS